MGQAAQAAATTESCRYLMKQHIISHRRWNGSPLVVRFPENVASGQACSSSPLAETGNALGELQDNVGRRSLHTRCNGLYGSTKAFDGHGQFGSRTP